MKSVERWGETVYAKALCQERAKTKEIESRWQERRQRRGGWWGWRRQAGARQ